MWRNAKSSSRRLNAWAAFLFGLMRVQPKGHASMSTGINSTRTPDILVRNEGIVFLFCPLTDSAQKAELLLG
jgi:hypothetical protein